MFIIKTNTFRKTEHFYSLIYRGTWREGAYLRLRSMKIVGMSKRRVPIGAKNENKQNEFTTFFIELMQQINTRSAREEEYICSTGKFTIYWNSNFRPDHDFNSRPLKPTLLTVSGHLYTCTSVGKQNEKSLSLSLSIISGITL